MREQNEKAYVEQEQVQDSRKQQIDELKAALPSTPPQRMRATIHVNPITTFALLSKSAKAALQRYAVDMILEMPEKDRALIREGHLEQVVVEKVPKYSTDHILDIFGEQEKKIDELRRRGKFEDHVALEAIKATEQRSVASYRAETREITLGDYLRVPFTRIFDTKPEANEYADKLKSAILPHIREMLDKNASRQTSATIEF